MGLINTQIKLSNLQRFIVAHEGASRFSNISYEQALSEVKKGSKSTHWIWYIFPQLKGLPVHSKPSIYYAIENREEAKEYLNHPILRAHLIEITQAVLDTNKAAYEIFGDDAVKVKSCMKLFASVSDIPQFKQLIKNNNWN